MFDKQGYEIQHFVLQKKRRNYETI